MKDYVVLNVDGHFVNVNRDKLDIHLNNLRKRNVTIHEPEDLLCSQNDEASQTKKEKVLSMLATGETDINVIAECCGCSVQYVKVLTKKDT